MALCILICMCRWYSVYGVLTTGGIGRVVHSYGRLIPHEFPITDLQQISGPDEIGRITCTVSSGMAWFGANGVHLSTVGVTQGGNKTTATLVVKTNSGGLQNQGLYCNASTVVSISFFYQFISRPSEWHDDIIHQSTNTMQ